MDRLAQNILPVRDFISEETDPIAIHLVILQTHNICICFKVLRFSLVNYVLPRYVCRILPVALYSYTCHIICALYNYMCLILVYVPCYLCRILLYVPYMSYNVMCHIICALYSYMYLVLVYVACYLCLMLLYVSYYVSYTVMCHIICALYSYLYRDCSLMIFLIVYRSFTR